MSEDTPIFDQNYRPQKRRKRPWHKGFSGHDPESIARVCAWRGEKDSAFEWLERAYVQRWGLSQIKVDPFLQKIRDDLRFTALLKKMNLSEN